MIKRDKFKLEINDVRATLTLIDVILVTHFNKSFAIFGLVVALLGIVRDFVEEKRWNGLIMHSADFLLYLYLLIGG